METLLSLQNETPWTKKKIKQREIPLLPVPAIFQNFQFEKCVHTRIQVCYTWKFTENIHALNFRREKKKPRVNTTSSRGGKNKKIRANTIAR